MKAMMCFTIEGVPAQFCMVMPEGAEIRELAARVAPNKFGVGQDIQTAIFAEGDSDDQHPPEFRTFGWVTRDQNIGGPENHRAVYRGHVFAFGLEVFLYEYPDVKPTQDMIESLADQMRIREEAAKNKEAAQSGGGIIVARN